MKKLRAWLEKESRHVLIAAIGFWAAGHALDLVSTGLALAIVPGVMEGNPMGNDPITKMFSLTGIILAKMLVGSISVLFPAMFLYIGTKRADITSLPFWYAGWTILPVVIQNFGVLMMYLRFGGY